MSNWYACRTVWNRDHDEDMGCDEAVFHDAIEAEDAEAALDEARELSKYPGWYLLSQSAIECVDGQEAEKLVSEWRSDEECVSLDRQSCDEWDGV